MGLDFLDLFLRVERDFGVRLKEADLASLGFRRKPPDITAGELLELILVAGPKCLTCRYDLRGHGDSGICPECAAPFDKPDIGRKYWDRLQRILAQVSGRKLETIQVENLLLRDLGFS